MENNHGHDDAHVDATPNQWKKELMMTLHDVVYLLVIVLLIFTFCFRMIVVSGDSMFSTLWDGDYLLLLSNVFYRNPQYGDIVVINKNDYKQESAIIKRVIATEGQTVDIDFVEGIVYVDGIALDEPYTHSLTTLEEGMAFPLTVRENCIFVLGDNRGVSKDSRSPEIGQIDKREVLGKAIFLMLPGTHHGRMFRDFDRMGVIE